MQYVNFVYEDGDDATRYTGPVDDSDAAYLRQAAAHLKPLSDEEYMTGPAAILYTAARYSYVLDGERLYWCIEWDPGLLVFRLGPGAEMQWVALRSPVPNFGDREPLPEDDDPDEYDEDEDNPQYNLIFTPFDAQYDEWHRKEDSFVPADADVERRFESALAHVNALADVMESRYSDDREAWIEQCKRNLDEWSGVGVRLKPAG